MAFQDLERGHGFALIDPHGDLVARIAAQVLHRGGGTSSIWMPRIRANRTATIRCGMCGRIGSTLAASGMMDVFKKITHDIASSPCPRGYANESISSVCPIQAANRISAPGRCG